jgi:hypothetical protein
MPQRAFENGYIDGWVWVTGNDQISAIPPYETGGLMPYQAGVSEGVRDACIAGSARSPSSNSDPAQFWIDQFLNRKPVSWRGEERRGDDGQRFNKSSAVSTTRARRVARGCRSLATR